MRTTFISTSTLWNSPRASLGRLQESLAKANSELTTGRHADVGLKLGSRTGETISLRNQRAELDALIDSNANASVRVETTSTILANIHDNAVKFLSEMVALPPGAAQTVVIRNQSKLYLDSLISDVNTAVSGQYIFGGTNTQAEPLAEYENDGHPTSLKRMIESAFTTRFGFPQDSPLVSGIRPDEMVRFIEEDLGPLFEEENWKGISRASSHNIQSLISTSEMIETSTNANSVAVRQTVMAYAMVFDLGLESLNDQTRETLVTKAVETLSKGISGLVAVRAEMGISQAKIDTANQRMELQKTVFERGIVDLEAVDPAEAKVRIDQLMTQIQMSYSLTSQLRQLSLIHFL